MQETACETPGHVHALQERVCALSRKLQGDAIVKKDQRIRKDSLNHSIRSVFDQLEFSRKRAFTIHLALLSPTDECLPFLSSVLEEKPTKATSVNVLKTSDLIERFLGDKSELATRVVNFCQTHKNHIDEITFSLIPSCFGLLSSTEAQNDFMEFLERVSAIDSDVCTKLSRVCFILDDFLDILKFIRGKFLFPIHSITDENSTREFLQNLLANLRDFCQLIPPILFSLARSSNASQIFETAFFLEALAYPHLFCLTGDGEDFHPDIDTAVKFLAPQSEKFSTDFIDILRASKSEKEDTVGNAEKEIPQFSSTYFFTQHDIRLMDAIMTGGDLPSFMESPYAVTPIDICAYKAEPEREQKRSTRDSLLYDLLMDSDPSALVAAKFDDIMTFVERACVEMAPSYLSTKQRVRFELFKAAGDPAFEDILLALEQSVEKPANGKGADLITYAKLDNDLRCNLLNLKRILTNLVVVSKMWIIEKCFESHVQSSGGRLTIDSEDWKDENRLIERVGSYSSELQVFCSENQVTVSIEPVLLLRKIFSGDKYEKFMAACPEVGKLNDALIPFCDELVEIVCRDAVKVKKVLQENERSLDPYAEEARHIFEDEISDGIFWTRLLKLISDVNGFLSCHLGEIGADDLTPAFHYIIFRAKAKRFPSRAEYICRTCLLPAFYDAWTKDKVLGAQREHGIIYVIGGFQALLGRCEESDRQLSWYSRLQG